MTVGKFLHSGRHLGEVFLLLIPLLHFEIVAGGAMLGVRFVAHPISYLGLLVECP